MMFPANSYRHAAALACVCLAITMNADAASEKMLFDFQGAINSPAWQIVNDDGFPHSPTPVSVLPVPGAAGAKAISQQ